MPQIAGRFLSKGGSIALPGFAFEEDQSSGLYMEANGNVAVSVKGSKVLTLNTAGVYTAGVADDVLFALGSTAQVALVNRHTVLNANTVLAGVIVGTPVTPAVAIDTLILGNTTADGDIMLATQTGGNSHAAMWVDASAAITRLYSGAGVEVLKLDSAALTATGTLTVTSANASALAVGRLGATTPALLVDASTGTSITGVKVKAAATGGGVALSAIGETNVALTIDANGSGTVTIAATSTGVIALSRDTTITGQIRSGASSDGSTPGISTIGFKQGTAPVGAATTTSKVYADATVLRKIVAAGTDTAVG